MMKNQIHTKEELCTVIQSLTGQANLLTIPRELSRFLGDDLPAALLLSQLVYWQGKQGRSDGAIYKTYAEWYEEIGLTEYQVRRATRKLSEFLRTEIHRAHGSPTVHYYLDVGQFSVSILKFLKERNRSFSRNGTEVSQDLLTETTAHTTTKTTCHYEEEGEDSPSLVLDFFKQNFPKIEFTPVIREELEDNLKHFGPKQVTAAIREAARREDVKQKLPYIRAVLESWKKDESAAAQEKGQYVNFDSAPYCYFNYEEVLDLVKRFGNDGAAARINFISRHKGSTGQTYASDYETILKWDARGNPWDGTEWNPEPQGWEINQQWLDSLQPKPVPWRKGLMVDSVCRFCGRTFRAQKPKNGLPPATHCNRQACVDEDREEWRASAAPAPLGAASLNHLTSREKEVLKLRFGLRDGKHPTFNETANELQLCPSYVREVEVKALNKLYGRRLSLKEQRERFATDVGWGSLEVESAVIKL